MGIERFYTCKLSFHCFLLILLMQIGNILLYPWLARIRAGAEFEELAQIDSIGFQGLVVEFLTVAAVVQIIVYSFVWCHGWVLLGFLR